MKSFLLVLCIGFLTSCTASHTHNHYHHQSDDDYFRNEVVNHSYHDRGDHIVVVVNHRHNLTKKQRQRLRRWCNRHYGHHRKRIKCQFVLG